MKKELFSKIEKQIKEDTPELDLNEILSKAEILEGNPSKNIKKPKLHWISRPLFKFGFSFVLTIFLIIFIVSSIQNSPSKSDGTNTEMLDTPIYLNSALSLYFLSEEKTSLDSNLEIPLELKNDLAFLNQYLKTFDTYFLKPSFENIEGNWEFNSITIETNEEVDSEKTNLEIKIIEGNENKVITGYYTKNELYLKLEYSLVNYLEMQVFDKQVHYKINEEGNIISHASFKETANGLELKNIKIENSNVLYLINKIGKNYEVMYYGEISDEMSESYYEQEIEAFILINMNDIPNYEVRVGQDKYYLN